MSGMKKWYLQATLSDSSIFLPTSFLTEKTEPKNRTFSADGSDDWFFIDFKSIDQNDTDLIFFELPLF